MNNHTQTYWALLGRGISLAKANYPQGLTDQILFAHDGIRSDATPVVIKIEFNPVTGSVSATVEKNVPFAEFDKERSTK